MFGPEERDDSTKGLIPRMVDILFRAISAQRIDEEPMCRASFVEVEWQRRRSSCSAGQVYKEEVFDLLQSKKTKLKLRETPVRDIQGGKEELVTLLGWRNSCRGVSHSGDYYVGAAVRGHQAG